MKNVEFLALSFGTFLERTLLMSVSQATGCLRLRDFLFQLNFQFIEITVAKNPTITT